MLSRDDFRLARRRRRWKLCASASLLFSAAIGTIILIERHFGPIQSSDREISASATVGEGEPRTVYFLRGHGERTPDRVLGDGGLGRLCRWIGENGWRIDSVDGGRIGEVAGPDSLLAILDPLLPLNSQERVALRDLLEERNGRVLLLLTPQSHSTLGEFLGHWNVLADPPNALPAGPDGDIGAADPNATDPLPVRFQSLRVLREDPDRPAGDRFAVRELLRSGAAPVAVSVRNGYGPTNWELTAVGGSFLDNRHFALAGNRQFLRQIFCHLLGDQPKGPDRPEEFQLHVEGGGLVRLAISCLTLPLLFLALPWLLRLSRRDRGSLP
ncbi:MAG: hypothetical protein LBF24_02615 [Puniceicoccales bacterium]|nr:hypothetical protein [Puniceicoccales bacterium]